VVNQQMVPSWNMEY